MSSIPSDQPGAPVDTDIVIRHRLPDRVFHWTMAVAVFVLLGTAFLPIAGLKFPWIDAHWIAGTVLGIIVVMHIVRALIWQDRTSMGLGRADIRGAVQSAKFILRLRREAPERPGKYPLLQKLYHHGIAVIMLILIGTGAAMMAKIDTPFWQRDPYIFAADTWGWIYVAHDLAAMAVLFMVVVHIYFAIRPEKLWITRSMLRGWITRAEYTRHHDPKIWNADGD